MKRKERIKLFNEFQESEDGANESEDDDLLYTSSLTNLTSGTLDSTL